MAIIPTPFGGFWIVPGSDIDGRRAEEVLGESYPLEPLDGVRGWIVEPQDAEAVLEAIGGHDAL